MADWPVYGHDWAVQHLQKSIAHRRVRHAYLFIGPESVGKHTLAQALAMTLNCTAPEDQRPCGECRACRMIRSGSHPDLIYGELDATSGRLRIEAVRAVTRALSMKPFEARYRIAILPEFDRTFGPAQDALLKTLEEPPPAAVLILLARAQAGLLSTITSRSQVLHLRPLSLAAAREILQTRYQAEDADLLARLSGGRLGWAITALADDEERTRRSTDLDLLEDCLAGDRAQRFALAEKLNKERDKQGVQRMLELWQSYWRDVLLLRTESRVEPTNIDRLVDLQRRSLASTTDEVFAALKATRTLLDNLSTNLNLRLALETLMLDYPDLDR